MAKQLLKAVIQLDAQIEDLKTAIATVADEELEPLCSLKDKLQHERGALALEVSRLAHSERATFSRKGQRAAEKQSEQEASVARARELVSNGLDHELAV